MKLLSYKLVPITESPETSTGIPVGTSFQLEGYSSSNTKQLQSDKNMDAEQSGDKDIIATQQQQQKVSLLVSERPVSQMQNEQLPMVMSSQHSGKSITEDQVAQTSRIASSECHPQQLQISHNQPCKSKTTAVVSTLLGNFFNATSVQNVFHTPYNIILNLVVYIVGKRKPQTATEIIL